MVVGCQQIMERRSAGSAGTATASSRAFGVASANGGIPRPPNPRASDQRSGHHAGQAGVSSSLSECVGGRDRDSLTRYAELLDGREKKRLCCWRCVASKTRLLVARSTASARTTIARDAAVARAVSDRPARSPRGSRRRRRSTAWRPLRRRSAPTDAQQQECGASPEPQRATIEVSARMTVGFPSALRTGWIPEPPTMTQRRRPRRASGRLQGRFFPRHRGL